VRPLKTGILTMFLVLGMLPNTMAQTAAVVTAPHAALPYPTPATPKAIDLGPLTAQSGATRISITIALKLPALSEAEKLLTSLYTPGDPQFHQFLTADQFVARFAPAEADVAKVVAVLAKYGLAAQRTTATTLKVTGLPADMERAFAVSLHRYEIATHDNVLGYTFQAPLSRATVPAEISASVAAVVGLDSRPSFRPHYVAAPRRQTKVASTGSSPSTPDPPGFWTVTDFADYYDVQPLYSAGLSGRGRTLAIVTLASFTPSDAFAYWSALGLTVAANRLKIVNVDGGPGAPSDASGSLETTLDVEQSGGVAPGAKIIVYQAPNTNQAFLDAFAAAIDSNSAETVSTSWGIWEWLDNLENAPVTDPTTGQTGGFTTATHELLVRAAIQGQTFFAASGDGGAYDATDSIGCFGPFSPTVPDSCSQPLSVDYPGSDTAITASGGTTLAGVQELCLNAACTAPFFDVDVPHERVWGWDYLEGWCAAIGFPNPVTCGIFPGGSGGGVSIMFGVPSYQSGLSGIQLSQPGQVWQTTKALASELDIPAFFALPAFYPGRNVPDVSFNADPDTGYVIYYTSSVTGFGIEPFWGGTSFVGPQLNGVSALLSQLVESRIGLLNQPLYDLAQNGQAYGGSAAPLHAIAFGDNWFYRGSNGYNPAAGLGTLNVANFANTLRHQF
jgi:kumamolisin